MSGEKEREGQRSSVQQHGQGCLRGAGAVGRGARFSPAFGGLWLSPARSAKSRVNTRGSSLLGNSVDEEQHCQSRRASTSYFRVLNGISNHPKLYLFLFP